MSSAQETDEEILVRAQRTLMQNRSGIAAQDERDRPKRAAEVPGVIAIRRLGPNTCSMCERPIIHPGICSECGRAVRADAIAEQVAPAFVSVPTVYNARWGTKELLRRAPSLAKDRRGPEFFLGRPVLLLCGETGAGKSSFASALFWYIVDRLATEAIDADQDAVDFVSRARWVEARDVPAPGDGALIAWRASILVIDDVGQEGGTGESFACQDRQRAMADLLDKLYTHRVFGQSRGRIILTTYGTPEMWRKWYGAGVARRYWEDAEHVLKVELKR